MKTFITGIICFIISAVSLNAQWSVLSIVSQNYPSNFIVVQNGELFVTTNDGVYKSSDNGQTWTEITNNFIVDAANANRYIEFAGSNIYVGTTIKGIYSSSDNGATWQFDTTGLGSFNFGPEISLLYTDGTTVFSSLNWPDYAFYRKTVGAAQWERVVSGSIGTNQNTEVLGLTKIGSELYAATPVNGIYVSTDDGVTWTQKANNNFPSDGTVFAFNSNRLTSIGNTL